MKNFIYIITQSLLKINIMMSHLLMQLISWNGGRLISLNHIQNLHRYSFKIILDVNYFQNDLQTLLYNTFLFLNQLDIYKNIKHKTILITIGDGRMLSLHKAIFIDSTFNLDAFYDLALIGLDKIQGYGKALETADIKVIEILVIDQDRVWVNSSLNTLRKLGNRSYSTAITPIKKGNIIAAPIVTMNIKNVTIDNENVPCLISLTHSNPLNKGLISKPFSLRTNINMIMAMNTLWSNVFKYIISNHKFKTIFVHNLAESGLYIYKYLFQSFSKSSISCIIDNDNKFITITWKIHSRTITWLDSNRIFPVNIVDLCKIFEVKICLMNPISIDKLYREHNWIYQAEAVEECQSFYQALIKAQAQYLTNYSIDITKVVSTSSLSLQIYRKILCR